MQSLLTPAVLMCGMVWGASATTLRASVHHDLSSNARSSLLHTRDAPSSTLLPQDDAQCEMVDTRRAATAAADEEDEVEYFEVRERRYDAQDGGAYTKAEFVEYYGERIGDDNWNAAPVADYDVSRALEIAIREADEAKRSALAKLKRSAMNEMSRLKKAASNTARALAGLKEARPHP